MKPRVQVTLLIDRDLLRILAAAARLNNTTTEYAAATMLEAAIDRASNQLVDDGRGNR